MNYQQLQTEFKKRNFIIFRYKDKYYSLQKRKRWFRTIYLLLDTDNPPQQSDSLDSLFQQAHLCDGLLLDKIRDNIDVVRNDDPLGLSYQAIRHDVVIYGREVYFSHDGKYYWIAHTQKGESHLSDDFGNSQTFLSSKELFANARIDGKTLEEIWNTVIVEAC